MTRIITFQPPEDGPGGDSGVPHDSEPSESGRLVLSWPRSIRVGDAELIEMTLEAGEAGGVYRAGSAPAEGEDFNLAAEARLDLPGMSAAPSGEILEPLAPGQPAQFFWSVRPRERGDYTGTLWIYLRYFPHPENDRYLPEGRQVLSAQRIELRAARLLGLGGLPARVAGGIGIAAGLVLLWIALRSGWNHPTE